jgi:hypothetical protein
LLGVSQDKSWKKKVNLSPPSSLFHSLALKL